MRSWGLLGCGSPRTTEARPTRPAPRCRAFAEGLYAAIRNPGMHVPTDGGEEQLALEQLAAFSLLARWVDQAEVVEG
ncbi:MAG: TIGR02391 family protein [Acidimicrobiia bacterium]|nr:TIGR02391 family protein [Acidimicrobiia bacterium]